MDKQKQIDISKVKSPEIRKRLEICEMEKHINSGFDIAYKMKTSNFPNCIAETLYDAGYRKILENAVVIEKTEYDKLRLLADECIDWRRKNCNVGELPKENAVVLTQKELIEMQLKYYNGGAKETAEKFAERAKESAEIKALAIVVDGKLYPIYKAIVNKIDEICKEIIGGVR